MHKVKNQKAERNLGNTILSVCAIAVMAASWIGTSVLSNGMQGKISDLNQQVSNLSVKVKQQKTDDASEGDISKVTKETLDALNQKSSSLADLVNSMNRAQYEKSVSANEDEETQHFTELQSYANQAKAMFSDEDSQNLTLMPWYNGADDLGHQVWKALKVYDFTGGSAPVWFECTGGKDGKGGELLAYASATYDFTDKQFHDLKITTTSDGARYIVGTGSDVDTDANHVGQSAEQRQEEVQGEDVTGILDYINQYMEEHPDAGQDTMTEQEKQDQQDAIKAREEFKEQYQNSDSDN